MQEVIAVLRRLKAGDKVDHYELVRLKTRLDQWTKGLFAGAVFGWILSPLFAVGAWGCLVLVMVLDHRYMV